MATGRTPVPSKQDTWTPCTTPSWISTGSDWPRRPRIAPSACSTSQVVDKRRSPSSKDTKDRCGVWLGPILPLAASSPRAPLTPRPPCGKKSHLPVGTKCVRPRARRRSVTKRCERARGREQETKETCERKLVRTDRNPKQGIRRCADLHVLDPPRSMTNVERTDDTQVYTTPSNLHQSSVNCVDWAPHQVGLCFACGSSDGSLSVVSQRNDGGWDAQKIPDAHALGVTSVSWAPFQAGASSENGGTMPNYLVSGGCDNCVRIWAQNDKTATWAEVCCLEGHIDWVRDVAWAPGAWVPKNTIASCSQDGTVIVWTLGDASQDWQKNVIQKVDVPVWSVSWSLTGDILACSDGSNNVTLWKEALDGEWQKLSDSI